MYLIEKYSLVYGLFCVSSLRRITVRIDAEEMEMHNQKFLSAGGHENGSNLVNIQATETIILLTCVKNL